jgi:hypothetical protein
LAVGLASTQPRGIITALDADDMIEVVTTRAIRCRGRLRGAPVIVGRLCPSLVRHGAVARDQSQVVGCSWQQGSSTTVEWKSTSAGPT